MCGQRFVSVLLSLCLFGLSLPSLSYSEEVTADLPTTSQTPAPLWDELLLLTGNLPANFDSFVATLEMRIGLLSDSNKRLTTSNASLTESLQQSETRAETSENRSTQLQTDLDASTLSITLAEKEAAHLEKSLRFHKFIEKAAITAALVFGGMWASSTF